MHVYCDLFDVLEIVERNEDFATEAPTLLFVKASGIFINFLLFVPMHD